MCEEMGHAAKVELVVANWPFEVGFGSSTLAIDRAQTHGAV